LKPGVRGTAKTTSRDHARMPSELCQYQTPIPTQIVSSDEFYPDPQNERQREVESRLLAMADDITLIKGLGVDHVCWGTDALWTDAPQ
jgi:hypothetical protein